jgi:hypothetical protein
VTTPTLDLEFVFQIRIDFKERVRFPSPMGGRVYVPVAGGTISGPRLQGKVLPYSGGDYARAHLDGAGDLNAHYMLEAADGTPIYIYNKGYLYGMRPDGTPIPQAEKKGFEIASSTYFVCTPVFDCPIGPHDWLTRTVIVGKGKRIPEPDHTIFDYFAVKAQKQ